MNETNKPLIDRDYIPVLILGVSDVLRLMQSENPDFGSAQETTNNALFALSYFLDLVGNEAERMLEDLYKK